MVPAGSSISIGYTFKSASASVTSSSQVSRTTITPTDIAPNGATSINIGAVALFAAGIAGILFGLQLVV